MLNGEASAAEADTAGTSTDSVNPFSTSTDASANPIGFTSAGNSDTPATDGTAQVSGSDASADAADAAAFEAALSGFETTEKIPESEVLSFLALQEMAHARLYASVPWLMPRFEALIGKYARGISIDLDAMEEQLRDAHVDGSGVDFRRGESHQGRHPRHSRTARGAGFAGIAAGDGRGLGGLRGVARRYGPSASYRTVA